MRGFSGIRLRKTVILPILALALASTLAACGGASTANGSANNSGATGTSANSGGCKSQLSTDGINLIRSDEVAGHIRYLFAFSNDGSSPCTLEGYPTVTVDNSAITVITTTSADTWSNVAIEPVTLAPNDFALFALQGRDERTNCVMVHPSIAPPQDTKGAPNSATITVCGGKLYVSPVISNPEAFNR